MHADGRIGKTIRLTGPCAVQGVEARACSKVCDDLDLKNGHLWH